MVDKFWTYVPITKELMDDVRGMQFAVEKNFRERQNTERFHEHRRDPMIEIEGRGPWDTPLWNSECEGGCCQCCEEGHVGTFFDLTGRAR